ncbi:MAG: hypothetical protein JSV61_16175 [Anaerolineales bacterium]|nr:MAG: hypothetical protein JSV61_16175 [Anaerolineales bacterium]
MDATNAILTLMTGLLVRFGLPVIITIIMIWVLRRWDQRWQAEAETAGMQVTAHNIGCWKINKCPPENLADCLAYQQPVKPCWQVFREENGGHLKEDCLGCEVFQQAPIPVVS